MQRYMDKKIRVCDKNSIPLARFLKRHTMKRICRYMWSLSFIVLLWENLDLSADNKENMQTIQTDLWKQFSLVESEPNREANLRLKLADDRALILKSLLWL